MLLVCDAGYVGYDLFGHLLKQQCSFLIRLSSQAQLYSLEMVKVEGFTEGEFWYWTDDAESKSQPALHVRVIRVAAKKRHNDVWLVTNVLDPKRLPAGLAARFYRMRWESECFFRTYKRVVKDVRLVSRTAPMVVREAEVSLLACQLLLGQGALALKVGGKQAGRDERVFGNIRNLGNGESPGHDVDHGQMDHCLRCTCVEFIVLAHPPKPSQPCEGALHDPATRQELESLGIVASLHDL